MTHDRPTIAAVRCGRHDFAATGTTLTEVLVALGVAGSLAAMSVPAFAAWRDALGAAGAARHVAGLVERTRSQAIQSGEYMAIQFSETDQAAAMTVAVDGNRNGVRTAEIARGIDTRDAPIGRLREQFSGARFGLVPGVTDVETGAALTGSGVRLGGTALLSFSPYGACTSGTLYVRGRGDDQYAVRLLGATGRVRLLRFNPRTRSWTAP